MSIGFGSQRGIRVAGDRDELRAFALDDRYDDQQLRALPGIRKCNEYVVPGNHAEVAVTRFRRMHKERRRSGTCQRRCQLSGNVP